MWYRKKNEVKNYAGPFSCQGRSLASIPSSLNAHGRGRGSVKQYWPPKDIETLDHGWFSSLWLWWGKGLLPGMWGIKLLIFLKLSILFIYLSVCLSIYLSIVFLGPYPRHMEVLRLRGKSEPHLWPTPQLTAMLKPLSEARDQTAILMDTSQIHLCWATMGTPNYIFTIIEIKVVLRILQRSSQR